MIEFIINIITSPTFTVILTLLIFFQWFWNRAKDRSIVNSVVANRRMLGRILNSNDLVACSIAKNAIDNIDSILASLNERQPFTILVKKIVDNARQIFKQEKMQEIIIEK